MATLIHDGFTIDHTPTSAVAAGGVVVVGSIVGVAPRAISANALGAIQIEGVFE
ncbi:MAG: capsid cement protein, partial [Phycisphaerales bacterium]